MNYKIKQLESKIHALLAEIIATDVDNKLARQASIVEVELSGDKSIAKIYVNFYVKPKESLEALKNISGFIRSELSKNLTTQRSPELRFVIDEKLDDINHIERIIEENN